MRIAVVSETYPPEINGVALTVQSFVEQFSALGHEVLLTRPRQLAVDALLPPRGVCEQLVRGANLPRYPGLRFGLPSGAELRRFWSEHAPEAVYVATEGPLGWSAVAAANALGIPAATGFHTRFDDFVAHYGVGFLTPLVFAWLRRFHNRAGATLVPTRELQEFLIGKGFRQVRHLARGVDTSLFAPGRRSEALRRQWGLKPGQMAVIHVGRIAAEKNLALLGRAFHAIQAVRPDARCIIVGDGPALPALRTAHPQFEFAGMRRGVDLAEHFASGDLFLFPSLTETFGNVTLEAMASGVATVAFDYGAAREHLQHGRSGAAVAFGNEDAFVHAAVELAVDESLRRRCALAALDTVQGLSQRGVAEALVQLLREARAVHSRAA
ncbi:MAG: glycosyltransferase family 1 protein [Xanthomonadales bacterium]|nr:glycosyltransferase family 1 protein [Xanthomonadales bacterium]MBK7146735.1 glycosyltransferase family 1 protein [Xanthomonadales bacterium]MCC6560942.1 glycosyltransferase family 1 protein [Xanthomonadales bacterium]